MRSRPTSGASSKGDCWSAPWTSRIRPMPVEDGFEPDRLPGLPHPRKQAAFFGHVEAERAFLDAHRTERLHHAWLIGGPLGVGKATLAYRVARFLLGEGALGRGADTLDVSPHSAASHQVAALSHPN